MSIDATNPYLKTARARTSRSPDASLQPATGSQYGDQHVTVLNRRRLAEEGSYFVSTNPTPGTGIAGIAATGAFADAESLLLIQNLHTADEAINLYLDRIRLQTTAAGTAGTNHRYVVKTEPAGIDRYTSGGSTLTAVNPNRNSTLTSPARILFGALVTTAAGPAARLISNGLIRPVITVIGDEYTFVFGAEDDDSPGMPIEGTLVLDRVIDLPLVVLGPGETMVMSLHAASQTGATSYEVEIGFWER